MPETAIRFARITEIKRMSSTDALLHTALHDAHRALGGKLVDFAGWAMPIQYASIIQEHQATRRHVGLFDVSHMARLSFSGPDAVRLLDRVVSRRVEDLQPGRVRYSLLTNHEGGILDDILVYHLDQPGEYLVVANASNRHRVIDWFAEHRRPGENVQCVDRTRDTAMLAVQGPSARALVQDALGLPNADLNYYAVRTDRTRGEPYLISTTGYTGESGVELIVPGAHAVGLWEELLAAGSPDTPIVAAGLGARDTLRLEAGMPLYGQELNERINPYQAGLAFAVQAERRDFPGAETLRTLGRDLPATQRVGLKLDGRRAARPHFPILLGDDPVGEVTSGTYAPTLELPIAMGYVRQEQATPGTMLNVDIRGSRVRAEVVKLPFYRRSAS